MEDRRKNIDTCDKLGVALVKELCPICCKEMDGPIIMNQRLSRVQKEKVEKQMEGNQNAKEIIYKIVSQINIFKSHLHKLEDDLSTEVLHVINTSFMTELSQ